ncbi:MAG: exodeoxyribonuclease VII large subunit, partial [Casimicrobiaceae bacterium]
MTSPADPPHADPIAPLQPASRAPISVSALVSFARLALEREVGLVHVTGEISGFLRAASGHCYFALKDTNAQVRCVLWR